MENETMMSPEQISAEYINCVRLMHKTVHLFIRHVGLPWWLHDELFSQANLHFMIAAESYDGQSSKFSTWLCIQIWGRLLKDLQNRRRDYRAIKFRYHAWTETDEDDSPSWHPISHDRRFQHIEWMDELQPDARLLIEMVRAGDLDLNKIGRNHRIALRYVFQFLRKEGWSRVRIHRCFKNLQMLLE
jgi:DNA-directed RNA polymerase specialized sigma24 family protein